ncbi:acyl-CoA dehydrogenase family protein [Jatrophihabitans sp.]|uniref:acyl-CoA dehydrogenase family protein n=1 Tax=Jatrophihabitans sp. TaxID=1932789 RepID=UPI0030C77639|nr:fadE [Jatrophihabitans sp.]
MSEGQHSTDEAFRLEVRSWLEENLAGDFGALRGLGGPGSEHVAFDERLAWDRHLSAAGWTCLGWPVEHGGRGVSVQQQVIFHEEYARANAPHRANHMGEELLGPTVIAFGTPEQQARFLPRIKAIDELWCQGYSEPGSGSDLAAVSTSAYLEDGQWHVTGQKVWTSLAHLADWCFVVARTEPGSKGHRGLSYLLVPMDQPGIEVRPIQQLTGTSEFNEVFFDDARTDASLVVGEPGDGWRIAMGTLGFERGVATLGQQVGFRRELDHLVALARSTGAANDPLVRDRLLRSYRDLEVIRAHVLRTLESVTSGVPGTESSVAKLLWARWHRDLGQLAMQIRGADGLLTDADGLDEWQRLFLFTRADTIYGGSDEIQRNIIAERTLGLPREARP